MPRFTYASRLPVHREEAFAWHDRPGALERLSPPFLPGRVEHRDGSLAEGSKVVLRMGPTRLAPRWHARHITYDPPREFRDVQESGPFAVFDHRHLFTADGEETSTLTDDVVYRLPLGALGEVLAGTIVRRQLARMFAYRHRRTVADLAAHAAARRKGVTPMRIAITGSSGLIGEALTAFLTTGGHDVVRVVRRDPAEGEVFWDPGAGRIDANALRGVDAVVHLAGESIASGRWTPERKRRILESRTESTRLLAETLAGLGDEGPRTLVCASGINYYADGGQEVLTEESPAGDDFLARVCVAWEAAADPAREAGVRVAHLRTSAVLSPAGGALAKQLPIFRLGLGGRFGNGRQYDPWISLDDVVGLYHHVLTTPEIAGPVNATAPNPVTNAEFTRTLARVLRRPAVLPIPKFAPRLLLGEMVDGLLYPSLRAVPRVAEETGYRFAHPELEGCLRDVLGRPAT